MILPHVNELIERQEVLAAIEQAWIESKPDDLAERHEVGGWIYFNPVTGEIAIRTTTSGKQTKINLGNPLAIADFVLVAAYHTHPNPSDEGWLTGPSPKDFLVQRRLGVPGIIRAEDGIHVFG